MAKEIGGYKHYTIDAKEEFANEYIARGIKANAEYEGYPLSTALARPLIAQKIIDIAKKEGATAIAHGCTGKGNDQFRFEAVILAMSDLDIIAPIRELNLTRTEEQAYAAEKGIKLNSDKIYSIDENIWGRSIEGDILEDPANEPPEEIYAWTASAEDALDTPQKVSIEFEEGIPVAINGEMMPLIDIIKEANKIAGENVPIKPFVVFTKPTQFGPINRMPFLSAISTNSICCFIPSSPVSEYPEAKMIAAFTFFLAQSSNPSFTLSAAKQKMTKSTSFGIDNKLG